jgi:hypothetical protein
MLNTKESVPGLIYDLGMNNGDDTDYYLKRGFEVVAVEANPALCQVARDRFAEAIAARPVVDCRSGHWRPRWRGDLSRQSRQSSLEQHRHQLGRTR